MTEGSAPQWRTWTNWWTDIMRVFEGVDEARQHIESNLRGLAKEAMERAHDSRSRAGSESDERLRAIWRAEADAELAIAKRINAECDALLDRFALR